MTTFERIKELSKKQGKSLNKVEEELGYGKNVLYRLKDTNPSTERLQEIANYFGVTTDYLLGVVPNAEEPSTDLDVLLDSAMSYDGKPMTDNDREVIRAYLEGKFGNK